MNEIVKELQGIDLDLFYCADVWSDKITLQGKISSETVAYCRSKFGISDLTMCESGYLRCSSGKIKIILT